MEIRITCEGTDYVDFKKLKSLQGNLKNLSEGNLNKLKKSILKYGFTAPAFVWKSNRNKYILDAHQRVKALQSLFEDGYEIPNIPVVYIKAADRKEAKEKLLHISSQYGEFERDGFADFVLDVDIDVSELFTRLVGEEYILKADTLVEEFIEDDVSEDIIEIAIKVATEKEQKELFTEFQERGLECRLLRY